MNRVKNREIERIENSIKKKNIKNISRRSNRFSFKYNREEDRKFDGGSFDRWWIARRRIERREKFAKDRKNGKFGGEKSIFNRNRGENREDGKKSIVKIFYSGRSLGRAKMRWRDTKTMHVRMVRRKRGPVSRAAFGADPSNFTSREASNMRPTFSRHLDLCFCFFSFFLSFFLFFSLLLEFC